LLSHECRHVRQVDVAGSLVASEGILSA
jgi:hypothetical protein